MKTGDNSSKGGGNARIWKIACVVFLVAALVCGAIACAGSERQSEAEDEFERLAEQTNVEKTDPPATPEPSSEKPTPEPSETEPEETDPLEILENMGIPVPEKEVDFADLQANTNEDIYAWIYIPDTAIDYPILQHPTDNTYYLNYNLDGSRGYPGCIYTEDYNAKDFTDPVTVVYGHNMKDGSMFAGLHKYADSEYMESHPYVYIYTPDSLLVYEIFTAHETTDEHILYAHNWFEEKRVFEQYIDEVRDARIMGSVLREDVEVDGDGRILTLSTCISTKPNNRFVVQGVLLNASEE